MPRWVVLGALFACGCSSLLDFDDVTFTDDAGVNDPDASAGAGGGQAGGSGASPSGGSGGVAGTAGAGAGGSSGGTSGTAGSAGTGGSSTGGSGGSGGTGGSSTGGSNTGGSSTGGTGGTADPCDAIACADHEHCEPATLDCVCDPGFVSTGSGCEAALPGDPALHTEQEVCDQWSQGHDLIDPSPWSAGPTECDPGTLSRDGIDDTLVRINMFRWLVGLGPVSDSDSLNDMNMWCAVVSSWNPPGGGYNPHSPDPSRKCYTTEGAQGAGQSNIAWGPGHPAHAIDQFIQDSGNYTTFGHRRWIFNPPLGPVGIGYYAGGGSYGDAECLAVFGASGGGPFPEWIAFPPPGFAPLSIVEWVWTFHHQQSVSAAQMTVTRQSDSADLAMETMPLSGGYGSYSTIAFRPDGWSPAANETYLVNISGVGAGDITYEVKPTNCN